MNKDLIAIFEYLEREKGIKRDVVIAAIEDAIRAAAKKSVTTNADNISVKIQPKTGEIEIFVRKEIVETVENPEEEISLEDAQELTSECKLGQWLEISVPPQDFGRIAAQTARQIITQKLKGAERDVIYEEYRHRVNDIVSGTIKRFAFGKTMVIDLGKVEGLLPERNYPKTEKYHVGEKVQALLVEVKDTDSGGAEVILSRNHPEFVKQLFIQEVPELNDGTVSIEKIVREPGYRTKMVVKSHDAKVDPVGTCVGIRGSRIKNIIRELNNEKIDVIPFAEDRLKLLQNALAPIEIKRIKVTQDKITIIVNDEDYPNTIGKRGMNARLLSALIDTTIETHKMSEHFKFVAVQMAELGESTDPNLDNPLKIEGLSHLILAGLISSGYDTLRKLLQAKPQDLVTAVPGVNYLDLADKILEQRKKSV
jgi:N utilization substance protein A